MDEFDRMLYQDARQMPPDMVNQESPKPWEIPVKRISWGLILINITLNFYGLNIILPAVGTVLLWLGLRSLRRTNGGFRFACCCATVYAVLHMAAIVLQATPFDLAVSERIGMEWNTGTGTLPFYYALRNVVLQLTLTLTVTGLWRGLKAMFLDAGQIPRTATAGGLVILEAMMIPLALIGVNGWLTVGPLLILFIFLIWSLYKLGKSLNEAGYTLTPAQVRFPRWLAFGLWLGIPLAAVIALPILFSRLPVPEQTPVCDSDENTALRAELLNLGFPEDILSKLSDGELVKFQGAYGLTVKVKGQEDSSGSYPDGIPSVEMLEIPVRDDHYGFHTVYLAYLCWSAEEVSGGGYMEGIRVIPDWQGVTVHTSCPGGTLEWRDESGTFHTAPMSFYFRSDGSGVPSYYADFSLPKGVEGSVEGWVSWESDPAYPETLTVYNYQLAFAHRLTPWQYPYQLPSDVLLSGKGSPGWRVNYQRGYTGQLAPEGQYVPRGY
ncbi:MAG: DUF4133 domain-containing protein [bacterium]|nr:DUF4133 domain-containing protein [bacterium]